MQKALAEARESGTDQEVIGALANCCRALVDIMGEKPLQPFCKATLSIWFRLKNLP